MKLCSVLRIYSSDPFHIVLSMDAQIKNQRGSINTVLTQ
jgi:hypothetical protein